MARSADGLAYLADACALIGFLSGTGLGAAAASAMCSDAVGISAITVWEIARKSAIGKLPSNFGRGGLVALLRQQAFRQVGLEWADAAHAEALPALHGDPMDRMLIAQALRRGVCVITCDTIFGAYGVTMIW